MELRRARFAVVATFATAGFIFSNWAARLPVVKEQLDLTGSGLGILLLFASAGSLTALPITGILVDRFGTARVVGVMALTMMTGLAATVTAVVAGSTPIAAASLYLLGVGLGSWDVAMNVEGAAVEERLDKSVMAQFHATWSLGTVAGAGLGALMAGLGTPIHFHLYGVLACAVVTILVAVRNFLPRISPAQKIKDDVARLTAANSPEAPRELVTEPVTEPGTADLHTSEPSTAEPAVLTQPSGAVPYRSPWLEPRTLLIGVLVLAAALTEGSAMDWLAVTVKAELTSGWAEQSAEAMGAVALGIFLCAMTAMRLFGNGLLDRHTRVSVLRLSAALGLAGLLLFGLSPWLWLATIGIALWGLGAALAFPVGISAASDDPLRAARRVSVVASVGYASSLAAPPLIGLAADHLGYRNTLLLIAIPAAIGFLIASKAAPLPGSRAAKKEAALLAQKALQ